MRFGPVQVVTRRDQLAMKGETRGRGRGKGRGRGRGRKAQEAEENDKNDEEEDGEILEPEQGDDQEDDKTRKPPTQAPKAKAKPAAKTKAAAKAKTKAESSKKQKTMPAPSAELGDHEEPPKKAPKRSTSAAASGSTAKKAKAETPQESDKPLNEARVQKIVDFVNSVDFELDIKDQVKSALEPARTVASRLNIYWSRYACGVKYLKFEKDVAYFCFLKSPVKVSKQMKLVAAVSCARLFAP